MVEAILQVYKINQKSGKGARILACAPSNSAADLIVERLSSYVDKKDMFRMVAYQRDYASIPDKVKPYTKFDKFFDLPDAAEIAKFKVVVCTCVTAAKISSLVESTAKDFAHIFIDEAGHATEPETLVALSGLVQQYVIIFSVNYNNILL